MRQRSLAWCCACTGNGAAKLLLSPVNPALVPFVAFLLFFPMVLAQVLVLVAVVVTP